MYYMPQLKLDNYPKYLHILLTDRYSQIYYIPEYQDMQTFHYTFESYRNQIEKSVV